MHEELTKVASIMPVALPLVVSNATECPSRRCTRSYKVLYQHVGLRATDRVNADARGTHSVQALVTSVRKSVVCRCTRLPQRYQVVSRYHAHAGLI
jgi:hypothetical protein